MQTARPDQIETRRWIGAKRIAGVPQESRDHSVPRRIREIHVNPSARGIVRRECEPEQSLLATRQNDGCEIQEVLGEQHAVLDDAHASTLLDDDLNIRLRGILDERDRHARTRR